MGFGDVKFMAMVGGFVGPVGVLLVILLACMAGSVIGVIGWLVTRSHYIPFGPFLSLGTLLVLFFRAEIIHFVTVTYPSLFR
jgi:leader peptidase (prepilin peptidase)/N-methyltransferase